MSVPTASRSPVTRSTSALSAASSSRATSAWASTIWVSDCALLRSCASRARAASSSSADGVGAGVGEAIGVADVEGLADEEADRPDGEAEELAEGDADGLFAVDGDALGEGVALGDGDGVIGGVGEGAGVGSSAFADVGKKASSASATTTPTRNVRSIPGIACTRALIQRTQVHPADERGLAAARFLDLPAIGVQAGALDLEVLVAADLSPRHLVDRRAGIDALHDALILAELTHHELPFAVTDAQKQ